MVQGRDSDLSGNGVYQDLSDWVRMADWKSETNAVCGAVQTCECVQNETRVENIKR